MKDISCKEKSRDTKIPSKIRQVCLVGRFVFANSLTLDINGYCFVVDEAEIWVGSNNLQY